MKTEPKLLARKDSWHYQYFRFIRRVWGLHEEPRIISLCSYCQTMLWFSLTALVLMPFIVFGWLLLKLMRFSYKGLAAMGFMEKSDRNIEKYPLLIAIGLTKTGT